MSQRDPYAAIKASRQRRLQALRANHPAVLPLDPEMIVQNDGGKHHATIRSKPANQVDPEPFDVQARTERRSHPDPIATSLKEPTSPTPLSLTDTIRRQASSATSVSASEKRNTFLPIAMPRPDPPDLDDPQREYRSTFMDAPLNIHVPLTFQTNDDATTQVSELSNASELTGLNTFGGSSQYRGSAYCGGEQFRSFSQRLNDRGLRSVVEGSSPLHRFVEGGCTGNIGQFVGDDNPRSPNGGISGWRDVVSKVQETVASMTPTAKRTEVSGSGRWGSSMASHHGQDSSPQIRYEDLYSTNSNANEIGKGASNRTYTVSPGYTRSPTATPRKDVATSRLDPGEGGSLPDDIVQGPPTPRNRDEVFALIKETLSADGTVTIDTTNIGDEDLSTVFPGLQESIPSQSSQLLQKDDSLARSRDSTTFFSNLGPGSPTRFQRTGSNASKQVSQRQDRTNFQENKLPQVPEHASDTENEARDDQQTDNQSNFYDLSSSLMYIKAVAEDLGSQLQNLQGISFISDREMDNMLDVIKREVKKAKESATPEKRDELVRMIGEELEKTACGVDRSAKTDKDFILPSHDLLNKAREAYYATMQKSQRTEPAEDPDGSLPTS